MNVVDDSRGNMRSAAGQDLPVDSFPSMTRRAEDSSDPTDRISVKGTLTIDRNLCLQVMRLTSAVLEQLSGRQLPDHTRGRSPDFS